VSRIETRIVADRHLSSTPKAVPCPAISAAEVVHDLGILIQVAASALNVIARSPEAASGSALEHVVARARMSLQRAGTLVQQTIRLASAGSATVESVNLIACLFEVRALLESTWDSNIRIEMQANSDLPLVTCNREDLQSAMMNLLFNARDAMPTGGVISIIVAVTYEGHVQTEIELRISDNGLGMTPETMRRAFEPFFTTKSTGLGGLGLPMVKRFVQDAEGRLDIESEPGVGTTVTLRLPVSTSGAKQQAGGYCSSSVDRTSATDLPAASPPASRDSTSRTR
jgi:signal transduction histidine kinase